MELLPLLLLRPLLHPTAQPLPPLVLPYKLLHCRRVCPGSELAKTYLLAYVRTCIWLPTWFSLAVWLLPPSACLPA